MAVAMIFLASFTPNLRVRARFSKWASTMYRGGRSRLALHVAGDLGERREGPGAAELVEERAEAGELLGDGQPQIGLARDELAGDAVLVGVYEVDAVQLEVEEGAAPHPREQARADRGGRDQEGRADRGDPRPRRHGDGQLDDGGLAAAPRRRHGGPVRHGRGREGA